MERYKVRDIKCCLGKSVFVKENLNYGDYSLRVRGNYSPHIKIYAFGGMCTSNKQI